MHILMRHQTQSSLETQSALAQVQTLSQERHESLVETMLSSNRETLKAIRGSAISAFADPSLVSPQSDDHRWCTGIDHISSFPAITSDRALLEVLNLRARHCIKGTSMLYEIPAAPHDAHPHAMTWSAHLI